jgi:hypothetical protein
LRIWFFFTLALLLGLGHACELPIITGLVVSAEAGSSHHDHHDGDTADPDSSSADFASCDGLAATPPISMAATGLDALAATPAFDRVADTSAPVSALVAAPSPPPPRRPRFLLLATFLI